MTTYTIAMAAALAAAPALLPGTPSHCAAKEGAAGSPCAAISGEPTLAALVRRMERAMPARGLAQRAGHMPAAARSNRLPRRRALPHPLDLSGWRLSRRTSAHAHS